LAWILWRFTTHCRPICRSGWRCSWLSWGELVGWGCTRRSVGEAPARTGTLDGRMRTCRSVAATRSWHQGDPWRSARTPCDLLGAW
jgi:hypothetical protein